MSLLNGSPCPVGEDPGLESHSLLDEPHASHSQEGVPEDGTAGFANGPGGKHPDLRMAAASKFPFGGLSKVQRRSHRIPSRSVRKPLSFLTYSSLHSFREKSSGWPYYFSMASFAILSLFAALWLLNLVSAVPRPLRQLSTVDSNSSSYWVSNIQRQGVVAFGSSSYQIFRNVKDFGAVGDGVHDDTDAINNAISTGNRCGQGCDSSTLTPALVYFPPGTYAISKPIVQLYYTQLVGDAKSAATIKATPSFQGMALIDADPYSNGGDNWYTNQNNFYRQIRNLVIDITAMPFTVGAGIHWQVAQATSLQNIEFHMRTDGGASNKQVGIFMDNGSGGFMSNLIFKGGQYGMFLGSQQFTMSDLSFVGCQTAIFMNWNWGWTFHNVLIDGSQVGIDIANGDAGAQTVGSVLLIDSMIKNTAIGISTAYQTEETGTNGTLILENVDMVDNVPIAVSNADTNATILEGGAVVGSWMQGRQYLGANSGQAVQGIQPDVVRPAVLLAGDGKSIFSRGKPQYGDVPVSSFISAKAHGAKGDGVTDDTAAVQALFNAASATDIVYFDHGAYLITDTVKVPKDIKITGEIWPLIIAGGSNSFKDQANPKAVFQVGEPGDVGSVEMSDLIFEIQGPQPGAILIEWNVAQQSRGSAAMWDVHFRIGGSAGTELQSDNCSKNPNATADANPACEGAFLLLHITKQASAYLENVWAWVADHELDLADHNQINIFSGRGILVESAEGPVWLYGTSSEHSVFYNYQITNAKNVFMGLIQSETPYFQSNPNAITPFTVNTDFSDPDFSSTCGSSGTDLCAKSWGLRVTNSQDVFVYGAGLYSFFDNYDQECLKTESCQDNMVSLESSQNIFLYGLSTKAATNMVTLDGTSAALDSDNRNNFCATVGSFQVQGS